MMEVHGHPLVDVRSLTKRFRAGGTFINPRFVDAVDDVSFTIAPGETLGLVGESGSGKSTLGRTVIGLTPPTTGSSLVGGIEVATLRKSDRAQLWRRAQMVFQDPYSSLNPRLTVRESLAEPLRNFRIATGGEADRLIAETLDACGLSAQVARRYPREFSGGQRQRIGIARALLTRPELIIADEPVSALDVSVQAQIINLLLDLRAEFKLTYLFIAHDLSVVRHMSDRVGVMYRGRIVEIGDNDQVYDRPRHPYTKLLLGSVPFPDVARERDRLRRRVVQVTADLATPLTGCRFAPRCPMAQDLCRHTVPPLVPDDNGHAAACHFVLPGTPRCQ